MDWATEVFPFQYRIDLPRIVHCVWYTKSIPKPDFISVAKQGNRI